MNKYGAENWGRIFGLCENHTETGMTAVGRTEPCFFFLVTLKVSKSDVFASALYLKNQGSLCLQGDTSVLRKLVLFFP